MGFFDNIPDRGFFGKIGGGLQRVFGGDDLAAISPEQNAAAGRGAMVDAGLAALAGGSQGNTSLNVLAGAAMAGRGSGMERRAGFQTANNQARMQELAAQGPEALMAMFQQALAVGDSDSARAISEVLKTMGGRAGGGYNGVMKDIPMEDGLHRVLLDPRSGSIIQDYGRIPEDPQNRMRWKPDIITVADPDSLDTTQTRYAMYDYETGQLQMDPYGPDTRPQPRNLTEVQGKARAFLDMIGGANATIEEIMEDRGNVPFGRVNQILSRYGIRELLSTEEEQFNTASAIVSEAWLRNTTGAAYNEQELRTAIDTFSPRPGDDPETVEYKRQLRRRLQAMMLTLGGYRAPEGIDMYNLPPEILDLLRKGGQLQEIRNIQRAQQGGAGGQPLIPEAPGQETPYIPPEENVFNGVPRRGGN